MILIYFEIIKVLEQGRKYDEKYGTVSWMELDVKTDIR